MMGDMSYMFIYFNSTDRINNLLFEGWTSHTQTQLAGMCFTMVALVFLLELLKTLSEYLTVRIKAGPLSLVATVNVQSETSPLLRALQIPPSDECIRNYRLKLHAIKSLVLPVQMAVGYMLMLAIMSYNTWILVSVVIASACFHWVFSFFRELIHKRFSVCVEAKPESSQSELTQQDPTSSYGTESNEWYS